MTFKITFIDKGPGGLSLARTLDPCEVNNAEPGYHEFTHADGWTIKAVVHEEYYTWINAFEATHPEYGFVRGDFEWEVFASNKKAYEHFIKNHPYSVWDYGDI